MIRVELEGFIQALDDHSGLIRFFLDEQTGEIVERWLRAEELGAELY